VVHQIHRRSVEDNQIHGPTHRAGQVIRHIEVQAVKGAGRILIEQHRDVDIASRSRFAPGMTAKEIGADQPLWPIG
jgi:hypothetical protein